MAAFDYTDDFNIESASEEELHKRLSIIHGLTYVGFGDRINYNGHVFVIDMVQNEDGEGSYKYWYEGEEDTKEDWSSFKRGRKFAKDEEALVITLYNKGFKLSSIAYMYNSTSRTIRRILERNGVALRPKERKLTNEEREGIYEDHWLNNMPDSQIVEKYNLSDPNTISKVWRSETLKRIRAKIKQL